MATRGTSEDFPAVPRQYQEDPAPASRNRGAGTGRDPRVVIPCPQSTANLFGNKLQVSTSPRIDRDLDSASARFSRIFAQGAGFLYTQPYLLVGRKDVPRLFNNYMCHGRLHLSEVFASARLISHLSGLFASARLVSHLSEVFASARLVSHLSELFASARLVSHLLTSVERAKSFADVCLMDNTILTRARLIFLSSWRVSDHCESARRTCNIHI
jgi:hypothetical protein